MIGFTCCVNYSDMLALTWPLNKRFFNDFVVVTDPADRKTIDYCVKQNIFFFVSESHKQAGSLFNRAAMLNVAIEFCAKYYPREWLLSMDCDCVIHEVVDNLALIEKPWIANWCSPETMTPIYYGNFFDTAMIYGCPRKMIKEPCKVDIETLSDPARGEWFNYPYNLTAYLGYFQMFYNKAARNDETYKTVNDSDTAFLDNNFGINRARTFRNLVCYHLGENGVNWEGRKSKEWA